MFVTTHPKCLPGISHKLYKAGNQTYTICNCSPISPVRRFIARRLWHAAFSIACYDCLELPW